jgi:CRP/FNR family cyclic AMP-dependent transcriptional regulator
MATVLDLCARLPLKTFATGETILAEGGRAGVLYILRDGAVEILKGEFQITTVSEPGSFFGEMSVLLDMPHMATVKTLRGSTFHVAEDPLAFLGSGPELALALSRLLARRLHFVTTYLADLKRQFEDQSSHLGMVDEVLENLVHHQEAESQPGSERYPDPTVD